MAINIIKVLEYNKPKDIFEKKEYDKTSGTNNSISEMFSSNRWINNKIKQVPYFTYNVPLYTTVGGTTNYYGQDIYSIFTNIARPFIQFNFSANTDSFGTGTTIKHNIYKIDYNTYTKLHNDLNADESSKKSISTVERTKETITDKDGKKTTTFKDVEVEKFEKKEMLSAIDFHEGKEIVFQKDIIKNSYFEITNLLENPVVTITGATTGITSNIYNLFLNEYYKNLGSYKFHLFEDKAQYFLTTNFEFYRTQGKEFADFYQYKPQEGGLKEVNFQTEFIEETPIPSHVITAGTFSGISVMGNFFTYFLIPNKPKLQEPLVAGQLDTFSPTFRFSDVDDGDRYLLQVVYESGDSQSFSGTVFSYPLEKKDSALDTNEMLNVGDENWEIAKKNIDITRKMSFPLKHGRRFWYRIGNVKYIKNIFNVEQSVVTFSDINTAITSSDPLSSFIQVESDSPYTINIQGLQIPDYLDSDIESFSLSGMVSGSTVTGATVQLACPNGSYITQSTSNIGWFEFNELTSGNYTLNTFYRGYQQDSRTIAITGNTSIFVKLKLIWGNDVDTWGKLANEIYHE